MSTYLVLAADTDRVVTTVDQKRAAAMVRRRQIRPCGRRAFRLVSAANGGGVFHECRTHISRGGKMAAAGMSQIYTTSGGQNGAVDGFKTIFPEDQRFFLPGNCE